MRNLKKILALVLALVMSLSLVTIANASDFTDADDIAYEEAADVMSTIGVIEGFEDGSFDPDGTLTREQAAKLVTYMLLGDNAERLGIESSTFNDVAMTRWSAPAIEYCVSLGIIDGAGDGNFYPAGTLTGAAFAKVLLTAIGYDSEVEGLVGASWSVNTAALAMEVGLDSGIEDLSWSDGITREEAAQMALNTIKAPLVAYEGGTTITVNGAEVSIGSGDAYYITSTLAREQRISEEQLTNSNLYTVEFGERYFPNLRLNQETDEFERPSYTWVYENTELGTYVNYDMLTETYTAGVDGRDLYELLGRSTIEKYDLTYYVDGAVDTTITADSMYRGNTKDYVTTDNGVLTQVFIDHDTEEIIITSINTYLAQANADYNANSETLSLNVFEDDSDGVTKTVDSADVPNAVDVTEGQYVLVNMSKKDRTRLEVVKISDVEIMTDTTVTKFSTSSSKVVSKLTADGEEYSAAAKAYYDEEALYVYDASLLTDMSYNVYLDQYGYVIGVDLFEGEVNYVFITGYDRGKSHISIKTAEAAAIFLDGSMEEITVNVTATNKNIDKLPDTNNDGKYDDEYYHEWNGVGEIDLNTWYTYTVDGNDVYTLRPVEGRMLADEYDFTAADEYTINCSNVRVNDDAHGINGRAYGNDDSLYITVEPGEVDMSTQSDDAIVDVLGLYTGVQDVDIELTKNTRGSLDYSVYALKDSDDYIIAAIVLGDAQGSTSNYAYILGNAKSEGIVDGLYQWEFDAVMGGEKVTLTARSQYPNTIGELDVDNVQELRFDGDYVVDIRDIDPTKFIDSYTTDWDVNKEEIFFVDYTGETLELQGRTLQSDDSNDQGWTIISTSMPTVLRQIVNGDETTTNYSSMGEALAAVGDADTNASGLQFDGTIVMVLNGQGVAEWAFIDSDVEVTTGGKPVISGGDYEYYSYDWYVAGNGFGYMTYTVNRPEWLRKSPASGADLEYQFDVYANGQFFDRVTSGNVADGAEKDSDNWSTGWPILEPNTALTIENFKFTNLDEQDYYVRYVDQSGTELLNPSWTKVPNPYDTGDVDESSARKMISAGTPTTVTFDLDTASYVTGSDYSWSISGVDIDDIGAVTADSATVGTAATTNGDVTVKDGWMNYVTVTVNTKGTSQMYTVTGIEKTTMHGAYSAYNGYHAGKDLLIYNVASGGSDTANAATTVSKGADVTMYLGAGSIPATDGIGLKIVVTDGKEDYTIYRNNAETARTAFTINDVDRDITLSIKSIEEIDAPEVDILSSYWVNTNKNNKLDAGDKVVIVFSGDVTIGTVPTGTDVTADVADNTAGVSQVTYTIGAGYTAGDDLTLNFTAGTIEDAETGMQNTEDSITVDGTTGEVSR